MKIAERILKEENYILNNAEIKRQIDTNNKIIESMLSPNVFTLNNTVAQLLKENEILQQQCGHFFEDGYCIFCYKEEPKNDN